VSCSARPKYQSKDYEDWDLPRRVGNVPSGTLSSKVAPFMQPAVDIDLDRPMDEVRAELSKYPVKTRLNLKGTLIVARDIAHAQIKEMIDAGKPMPCNIFLTTHPVYYAGPAKNAQNRWPR